MSAVSISYRAADGSVPVFDLTAGDVLRDAAAVAPCSTALVEGARDTAGRRRWSYAGLLEAAERAARALLGRFAPGDRVAVWANNIPEWVILELAAGLAGITNRWAQRSLEGLPDVFDEGLGFPQGTKCHPSGRPPGVMLRRRGRTCRA